MNPADALHNVQTVHGPGRRRRRLRRQDRRARPLPVRLACLRRRRPGPGRPAERRQRRRHDVPLRRGRRPKPKPRPSDPRRCRAGRRGRPERRDDGPARHDQPAGRAPAAAADRHVARLDEPVGRQRTRDVVQSAPPVIGNQTPPSTARTATMPPIAGPIESAVSRCPRRIAERGERDQPDEDQPVIVSQSLSAEPHAERSRRRRRAAIRAAAAVRYAVSDLGPEVVARRQRGQPQLAVPADRALGRDPAARREHRVHRPERRQARP